MTTML
jgi:nucleoside-diphosphate-sugar epimerase